MEIVVYLKGYHVIKGIKTNHIVLNNVTNLSDIDDYLENYGIDLNNINTIDLR